MILRRFMKHVTDQNWFAVGLDVIVVITGIFLGMQVTDWNNQRKDADEEREYLVRVHADMAESVETQREQLEAAATIVSDMDYLIEKLLDGTFAEANQKRLLSGLDGAGNIPLPTTSMVTINELSSTGKLLLIQDIALRDAIGRIKTSYEYTSAEQDRSMLSLSTYQPFFAHLALYRPATDDTQIRSGYSMVADFDQLANDRDMINRLSIAHSWIIYTATVFQRHHNQTAALRDQLQEALSRPQN